MDSPKNMSQFRHLALPYRHPKRASDYFEPFANEPWAICLSSSGTEQGGRYDIIVARPFKTIEGFADHCLVTKAGTTTEASAFCFETLAQEWLPLYREKPDQVEGPDWPFNGGMVGYFSYDLGQQCEKLNFKAPNIETPFMMAGFYDWAIISDHRTKTCHLVQFNLDENTNLENLYQELEAFGLVNSKSKDLGRTTRLADSDNVEMHIADGEKTVSQTFPLARAWQNLMSPKIYETGFRAIQHHLRQGDTYQVNFTQGFKLPFTECPWQLFKHLNRLNQAPHSAFMRFADHAVLSLSPERFISITNGQVSTQPIKGTRPRDRDPHTDRSLAKELVASEKDQAENLMIVDLMRNDLGKICQPGSVKVPQLFELKSFASVHHLVSTVTGTLPSAKSALELFAAAFPAGSITGAPKRSAMTIIDRLEPINRSIYCGSIAYIDQFGEMDSSVTIRTLLHHQESLYAWAGGGIVTDSVMTQEYQECFDKLGKILTTIAKVDKTVL